MIVPDMNLLLYAYNDGAPYHEAAKRWWEGLLNGADRVGVPWVVCFDRVLAGDDSPKRADGGDLPSGRHRARPGLVLVR